MGVETPVFGQKIDSEKIHRLKAEFLELTAEDGFDDSVENRIKHLGMFLENKKASLTAEEIKELRQQLLPKAAPKQKGRYAGPDTKEERREIYD